jgi:hypothetical protein
MKNFGIVYKENINKKNEFWFWMSRREYDKVHIET